MLYLINQLSFCKHFFTFRFVLLRSFKKRNFTHYQLKFNFLVYFVTYFSRQKTLKFKILKPWVPRKFHVLQSWYVSAQTDKNWKSSLVVARFDLLPARGDYCIDVISVTSLKTERSLNDRDGHEKCEHKTSWQAIWRRTIAKSIKITD